MGIEQAQPAILAAFERQLRAVERHLRNMHLAGQRLHIGQLYVQLLEGQQLALVGVVHAHVAGMHIAAQLDDGARGLLERHFQIRVQHTADQLDRHRRRDVGQVRLQVQVLDRKACVGLAVIGKRRGLRLAGELAAVQIKSQLRQHGDLALGRQVADKGHAQLQALELVRLAHGVVAELGGAVFQRDVVEREQRGLAVVGLGVRVLQLLQDVVKIKLAGRGLRHAQHWLVDLDGVEHRRQAPQRLHVRIHIHALHRQLRRAARIAPGDLQVAHRQLQRPGFELHRANVHGAAQLLARDLLALGAQQPRQRQPRQRPDHQQRQHTPRQPAQPAHARAGFFLRGFLGFAHGAVLCQASMAALCPNNCLNR